MRTKLTYPQIIKKVLQDSNEWIPSYYFSKVNTDYGWIGSSGERRCRELAERGEIERKEEGRYTYYKAKPPIGFYKIESKEIPIWT
jgi:hypothetical protein